MSDAPLPRCPWCSEIVNDDDTVQCTMDGVTWHARCKDIHDAKRRRERRMKPQIGEADQAAWARMSEAAGATPVFFERTNDPRPIQFQPTIDYTITPQRFILDIPVEALANLTPDAHTRMLAMLNNWLTENKPVVVKGATRPASDAVPATGGDGLGSGGVVGTGLGAK